MKNKLLFIYVVTILTAVMFSGCGVGEEEHNLNTEEKVDMSLDQIEDSSDEYKEESIDESTEIMNDNNIEEEAGTVEVEETLEQDIKEQEVIGQEILEQEVIEQDVPEQEVIEQDVPEQEVIEQEVTEPIVGEVIASGTLANDSIEWQIIGSTLYVRGEGGIPSFDEGINWIELWGAENGVTAKAWQTYYGVVNEIVIEEGITSVGSYNFEGFANATKLTLPDTLESVGRYAFSGVGATTLNLPGSLKTASHGAFSNMPNLTYLFVPSNLKSIPSYGFANCYKLTKIEIEEGVTSIGEDAFCSLAYYDLEGVRHGGSNGYEIHIPSSVSYIGDYAFATGDTHGPITVYGKAGSYTEGWVKDVNIQPEVVFVAK